MKTGAELVGFKGSNMLNKQQFISDFEKFRSRQITDASDISRELFDDDNFDDNFDEDEIPLPKDEIIPDDLVINGGTSIKHYNSQPYGTGIEPNMSVDNGVSKIKNFADFTGVR